jgi:tRNA (adenine22-N1)-methyltransferase
MELSVRLHMIAECVEKGMTVADIGTDHGYVPIYLAKKKISPMVIAMDMNKEPLQKAQENALQYHQQEKIKTRLSDGLKELDPGEVDCIIISGMGGKLIQSILLESQDKVHTYKKWILSPHKDIDIVRETLENLNLEITHEDMILEDGHYYTVIVAEYNAQLQDKLTQSGIDQETKELHYKYGRYLIESKNKVLQYEIIEEMEKYIELIKQLDQRGLTSRMNELEGYIEKGKKVLGWMS